MFDCDFLICCSVSLLYSNCRDFNLCAECEATPREGIHPRTHLFIKLKKPVKHQPPIIPVLKKVSHLLNHFGISPTYVYKYNAT